MTPGAASASTRSSSPHQRHRHSHGLKSLGGVRSNEKPSLVTEATMRTSAQLRPPPHVLGAGTGYADQIGLDQRFLTALPGPGSTRNAPAAPSPTTSRRALADEANLRELEKLDPNDIGRA